MKINLHYIICVILITFVSQIEAQDKDYIAISLSLITDKQPDTPKQGESKEHLVALEDSAILSPKGTNENIPTYFRSHQELPQKFSGYAIELVRSQTPLAINYNLFERFGSVNVHQLENGEYSYCIILTNFQYHERVKKFAKEVVLPYVPDAQIYKYRNGKRKKK